MESKQPKQSQSKTRHSTTLGTLLFTFINLSLLTLLSWVLLEIWFCVLTFFLDIRCINLTIQEIVNNNLKILTRHYFLYSDIALNSIHHIQNSLHVIFNGYLNRNFEELSVGITIVILTRCCLFIALIPFMSVILFVLIIDGLVQRDIRKFQGARESTFLFHRLKPLAKISFFLLFFIFMVVPFWVSPELFLMPMVLLSGLFTMLAIKSFKKYL
ncbi:MAG: DUF4400 domain-containing protein [Gammaproteobacteria bacterium]